MTPDTQAPPQAPREPAGDRLLDHEYDGIREYDNPLPRWWLWLFYATIAFSVVYLLNIPGLGPGPGRLQSYEREMAKARERAAAIAALHPPLEVSDETLTRAARDPKALAAGRETFAMSCAPCHRADGGGNIGPNLTDDFWIHGARPIDVHGVIAGGVADKGMPAWSTMLPPDRVFHVAAYVLTLRGTHPENPRPPQGVRVELERDGGSPAGSGGGEPAHSHHDPAESGAPR